VQVPVADMLRFHKFTIGHAWRTDFGDPDNEEHFNYLRQYSPYHNVQMPTEGQFPATMLTTASHDDRCSASPFAVTVAAKSRVVDHAMSSWTHAFAPCERS
jgi:prolyl oligopeptidase PreP (S9A serine peptidase family)